MERGEGRRLEHDYDGRLQELQESSMVKIEDFKLQESYWSRLRSICSDCGWSIGQGLRILLGEKIREEYKKS